MPELSSNFWAVVGVVIALLALLIAIVAWLSPRPPRQRKISDFEGEVTLENQQKLARFLQSHHEQIVKLNIQMYPSDDGLINNWTTDTDVTRHSLNLQTGAPEGDCISEVEVILEAERGAAHSPMYFAYGGYNINGFFLVRVIPGFRMGCGQVRITEVSAEQMALRN